MTVFLSIGCSELEFTDVSDCENIKNDIKRDKCFVSLIEDIPSNNTELRVKICERIVNVETKDMCILEGAQKGWRFMPLDTLKNLCSNISNDYLIDSCSNIYIRLHLQPFR